jgi:hypothetical protein
MKKCERCPSPDNSRQAKLWKEIETLMPLQDMDASHSYERRLNTTKQIFWKLAKFYSSQDKGGYAPY